MSTEDLYRILDIAQDATEAEIKKAYFRKVKEFPNETHPEEFKKIRKAYETLSNPETRREYDTMSVYGEEIQQLEQIAYAAMQANDYEEAIAAFKKILIIEPSLRHIRNQLGLALTYNGEYDKAFHQYLKLLQTDDQNATYLYNFAYAKEKANEIDEAIQLYQTAFRYDPNDPNIIFSLVELYLDDKNCQAAAAALNKALEANDNNSFHNFIYLFRLVKVYIYAKDKAGIINTLDRIEKLVEAHPDEKQYVASEYAKIAHELFQLKRYDFAAYLTERAIEYDSNNEAIQGLHQDTIKNKEIILEFDQLDNDEKISNPVKYAIFLYLFGDEYDENEFEERYRQMLDTLELAATYEPEETSRSIKIINVKYPKIYELRKDFLEDFLQMSEKYTHVNRQYKQMKNDPRITNSLKRLIALYLSEVTDEERKNYFDDIMDEMSYENARDVIFAIEHLHNSYPYIYQLNPNFLQEIKKKLTDSSQHTPPQNHSHRPTPANTSKDTFNSSCFVATAAYGSPLANDLDLLRYYRDHYLAKHKFGRAFILMYYKIGPYVAKIVKRSPLLRKATRRVIGGLLVNLDNKYNLSTSVQQRRKLQMNSEK